MGRICDAIDVLFNGLPSAPASAAPDPIIVKGPAEPQKVYVPAGGGMVDVYVAKSKTYRAQRLNYQYAAETWAAANIFPGRLGQTAPVAPQKPTWDGMVYLTCAQAFSECGDDAELTKEKAFIHDGKAYIVTVLIQRDLAPKPKTAKGKRAK